MRRTAGMALLVVLAATLGIWMVLADALGMLMSFSSKQVKSTAPLAEASLTTILPVELMRKSDKDLPDKTVPEPF